MRSDRRLRLMLLTLLSLLAVVAGLNRVTNPFGAWKRFTLDEIYIDNPLTARVSTPYLLRNTRPRMLIVGSSRMLAGLSVEGGYRGGVLNASLPGASIDETVAIIRRARENGGLERVIWGVDFYMFDEHFGGYGDAETRLRVDGDTGQAIVESLLSWDALDASLRIVRRVMAVRRSSAPAPALPFPWPEQAIRESLAASRGTGLEAADAARVMQGLPWGVKELLEYQFSAKRSQALREEVARTREKGIDVIVIVPPLNEYELEKINQAGQWGTFQRWKRHLLAGGRYWDYSGYNRISHADFLFGDTSHFTPALGQVILRHVLGMGCRECGEIARDIEGAGVWVTKDTVDLHLARQDAERMARSGQSRYARAVEEAVRRVTIGAAGWRK